ADGEVAAVQRRLAELGERLRLERGAAQACRARARLLQQRGPRLESAADRDVELPQAQQHARPRRFGGRVERLQRAAQRLLGRAGLLARQVDAADALVELPGQLRPTGGRERLAIAGERLVVAAGRGPGLA